jgi:hypothetical protein
MLSLMFSCDERGVLISENTPWPIEDVAGAVGGDRSATIGCINELLAKGVARKDSRGAIFSSRMVDDEQRRKRERDKKRNQRGCPPPVPDLSPHCPHPSSIASSSSKQSSKQAAALDQIPSVVPVSVRQVYEAATSTPQDSGEYADGERDPRMDALTGIGLSNGAAYALIGKHKPPIDCVLNYVARALEPDVKNRTAFVTSAIREGWPKAETKTQREQPKKSPAVRSGAWE